MHYGVLIQNLESWLTRLFSKRLIESSEDEGHNDEEDYYTVVTKNCTQSSCALALHAANVFRAQWRSVLEDILTWPFSWQVIAPFCSSVPLRMSIVGCSLVCRMTFMACQSSSTRWIGGTLTTEKNTSLKA